MGPTTDNVVVFVEYTPFLRMSEYITRSPARNPRIVETMNVIVTLVATATPVDRVAAVGAVEDWHWIEYTS